MQHLAHDVRFAPRAFRRTPAFVGAVVAILAFGIGMAVAMFTTAATVLARRLPVADQHRLAVLWTSDAAGTELPPESTTLPALRASSRTMRAVAGVAHWDAAQQPYLDGDATRLLQQGIVTANYVQVLGARPALGRISRSCRTRPTRG